MIGGNSFKEWFGKLGVKPARALTIKGTPPTTAESCNTHNMLAHDAPVRAPARRRLRGTTSSARSTITSRHSRAGLWRGDLLHAAAWTISHLPLMAHSAAVGSGIENTPRYNEGIYFQQDKPFG